MGTHTENRFLTKYEQKHPMYLKFLNYIRFHKQSITEKAKREKK